MFYLSIPHDQQLIDAVRKVKGARWEPQLKLCAVKDSPEVREAIRQEGLEERLVEREGKRNAGKALTR